MSDSLECRWCGIKLIDRHYTCDKKECVAKTVDELLEKHHTVFDRLAQI